MSVSPDNERLHGGWMEHKASDNKWNPVWCVLKRDGTLFFFTTPETSLNTHIGTLHVTKESSFHYGPGDAKDGYRFDLHIQRKKKKFRARKQYDREMWRGYLETVITGAVPQDVTLSPQDLHIISSKFQRTPSSSPSPHLRPSAPVTSGDTSDLEGSASFSSGSLWQANRERRPSLPSVGSADTGSSGDGGFDPPTQRSLVKFSLHDGSQYSSDSGVSDNAGGPFMNHVFDRKGNATPSWFFADCNRILAEKILTECRSWGNTLMRVSGSALPTGSYVISKCLESSNKIVHYEVMRVAEGYKINAQNTTSTMTTLGEVMEFFIQLSGPVTTRPITSNDLLKLGVHYDDYDRGPIGPHLDLPVQNVARCESPDQEVYDIPVQPSPPPPCPGPLPPSNTSAKAPFLTWDKKKTDVKWPSEPDAAAGSKTLGAADRRQVKSVSGKPSIVQVSQILQEHDAVAKLDAVLNEEHRPRGAERKLPPLPAVPADRPKLCPSASSGYVNAASAPPDGEDVDGVDGHPRWNKRSQSVPVLQDLSATVPPRVAAPSIYKPGGGGTGGGGKIPPPTAPNTAGQRPRGASIDDPTVAVPAKAAQLLGTRRTSLPLYRLKHLHQRWSSRRRAAPLPLPPDYSSESSSSSNASPNTSDCDLDDGDSPHNQEEPRKMSLKELSQSLLSLKSCPDDSERVPEKANKSGRDCGEAESLSYCEVMIEPQRRSCVKPSTQSRPESMTYSEIRIDPPKKDLAAEGWPTQQPTEVGGLSKEEGEATEEDGGDVYYLHLLAEGEEVIYDAMYSSGQGAIHFWRPTPHDSDSSSLHSPCASSGFMLELQQKLQKRDQGKDQPPTRSLAGNSPPPPRSCQEDVEEYYEDISPYVNTSS